MNNVFNVKNVFCVASLAHLAAWIKKICELQFCQKQYIWSSFIIFTDISGYFFYMFAKRQPTFVFMIFCYKKGDWLFSKKMFRI